ncbi:hypothetical protein C7N43_26020 [Sphingobacteriales bacterium UPWRP_1]|nr:hypothetical protein BVG80_17825 [Sphingobacteriales bacterium TSM_CSM]PSJ74053.1 hypothetical protein C7N43_26020 [Sphingobacteriales bacterium UPWRP_1]
MSEESKNPLLKEFRAFFKKAQEKEAGLAEKTTPPAPENDEGGEGNIDQTEVAKEQLQETADNNDQTPPEIITPELNTIDTTPESKAGESVPPEQATEEATGTGQVSIEQNETENTTPDLENSEPTTELTETIPENIAGQITQPEQVTAESNITGQDSIEQNETETTEQAENNDNSDEQDKTTG